MNKGIDRQALHEYLWKHRKRQDIMSTTNGELAKALGITFPSMTRIFNRMVDEGRLKKLSNRRYQVIDPVLHAWEHPSSTYDSTDNIS